MLAWMLHEMGRSRGIISQPRMGSAPPRARWRERPRCGDRPKKGPIQPASSTAVSLGRKRFACLVSPRRRRGAAELPALLRGSSVRILHCTTLSSVFLLVMHCHATVLCRTPYPSFVHIPIVLVFRDQSFPPHPSFANVDWNATRMHHHVPCRPYRT
jgi:hypothetical protein